MPEPEPVDQSRVTVTPYDAARLAVDASSDRQATDIVLLDVRGITGFADFVVIITADNRRQLEAISNDLVDRIERFGLKMHHREGNSDSGWVLLDFGDLVINIFNLEQRERFRLEQIWNRAKPIIRIQ